MSSETRKYELKARAERQRETRRRIVEATSALHQEVGPAKTTVAEIARRAGVQRLTVYNHFPEDRDLFMACGGDYMQRHPLPDFDALLAKPEPRARTVNALEALYGRYRETEEMTAKIERDREAIPALDSVVRQTIDAGLNEVADALAAGFQVKGALRTRLRALLVVALDFWTWDRLNREGLDDRAAAELMAGAVDAIASPPGRAREG